MICIGNVLKTNPAEFDEVWVICFAFDEVRSLFEVFDNVFVFRSWLQKKTCSKSIEVWFILASGINKFLKTAMFQDF